MLAEAICVTVTIYLLLRFWYERYTMKWEHFQEAPLPKYTLLGHVPSLTQISDVDFTKNCHEWFEKYNTDTIVLWKLHIPLLITRSRAIFESVLSSNKLITKTKSYSAIQNWLGGSILLLNGNSWRKRRKLLTPSFHFNILKDFLLVMEKHTIELVDALKLPSKTGKSFNVFKVLKLFSMGVIFETSMGVKSNVVNTAFDQDSSTNEKDRETLDIIMKIERVLETTFTRSYNPLYWYDSMFKCFPKGQEYYSDLAKIKRFAMNVMEKRNANSEKDTPERPRNDKDNTGSGNHKHTSIFLDKMLELYRNGDITIEDILGEVQAFIFAGYDTISTTLSWTLYLLGRNKDKQEKAHQEAVRIKALGLPIAESIAQLPYIECVIKESMRIHPAAGLIARDLEADTYIGDLFLPKSTSLYLAIFEIQRDAKNFSDPMVFKPERFLCFDGDSSKNKSSPEKIPTKKTSSDKKTFDVVKNVDGSDKKKAHPNRIGEVNTKSHFTFVPFSAGPRNCMGQKFAMMEMKTTIFHLLTEYEVIATQREEELKEMFSMIHCVENENGLEIKLRKR